MDSVIQVTVRAGDSYKIKRILTEISHRNRFVEIGRSETTEIPGSNMLQKTVSFCGSGDLPKLRKQEKMSREDGGVRLNSLADLMSQSRKDIKEVPIVDLHTFHNTIC